MLLLTSRLLLKLNTALQLHLSLVPLLIFSPSKPATDTSWWASLFTSPRGRCKHQGRAGGLCPLGPCCNPGAWDRADSRHLLNGWRVAEGLDERCCSQHSLRPIARGCVPIKGAFLPGRLFCGVTTFPKARLSPGELSL